MAYERLDFADLPGWADDDHGAALCAFRQSLCQLRTVFPDLVNPGQLPARDYFETHFLAHRVVVADQSNESTDVGLFTGYYEPVLKGARRCSDRFAVPLLRRPDDLETLVDDSKRAAAFDRLTHARRTADGLVPFPTREEIEQGCLAGEGLELLYLEDAVDAFILHVQGSGVIELEDGSRIRVSYAAKNGHPYTSIGKALIAEGKIAVGDMSLDTLATWLRADRDRGRRIMWLNRSYIFFRETGDAAQVGPFGVQGIPLTPGRSLAVDGDVHDIGLPVFVAIDDLPGTAGATRRLMVAQDAGSAIKGAVRADIFFGTGDEAGRLAGRTRHQGRMYVLLPRSGNGA